MPTLASSLQGHDLGYLRIVAEFWGIDLAATDVNAGIMILNSAILNRPKLDEMVGNLPEPAQKALFDLIRNGGMMPWTSFVRQYGDIREMGPGKRDRERPYEDSTTSAAEMLWYRALLARRFLDTPAGPAEFAYLADEWLELLPPIDSQPAVIYGRPASSEEHLEEVIANNSIVEDACTMLAGLRAGMSKGEISNELRCGGNSPFPLNADALEILLDEAGLLDEKRRPKSEPTRLFLAASPEKALLKLVNVWRNSEAFNELRLVPGMILDGEWRNDPFRTRRTLFEFLSTIPGGISGEKSTPGPWWSLSAFIAAVYQHQPDFQRQAGEYDAWYLRDESTGESLSGYDHWDKVEGELLRFIICGPLHWLGIVDLGLADPGNHGSPGAATAFRFSIGSADLLANNASSPIKGESQSLLVRSNGTVHAPPGTLRVARYQVARFCDWEGQKDGTYRYRISAAALQRARQQGLKMEHLLGLFRRYSKALPPGLVQALKRWEDQGCQARLENPTILRLKDPELLKTLRASRMNRFLGELLGPTVVIVKPGAWDKVVSSLVEMGYFVEEKGAE